ncbi:MAG: hypothetical protein AAF399_05475 [Bacteroidota bacterium]
MSIQLLKQSLHDLIEQIQDIELLAAYHKIISQGQDSDAEGNQEALALIKKGQADIQNGEVHSHPQILEEVRNLLKGKS